METLSTLLPLCEGNPRATGQPSQGASIMDLLYSLNKLLYKQSNGQWLKTLWRLCYVAVMNRCVGICKTDDNKVVTATAFGLNSDQRYNDM